LCCSPDIISVVISMMRWSGHVTLMGKVRNVYKIFVAKPERKRRRGKPRHRWENNIKMDL